MTDWLYFNLHFSRHLMRWVLAQQFHICYFMAYKPMFGSFHSTTKYFIGNYGTKTDSSLTWTITWTVCRTITWIRYRAYTSVVFQVDPCTCISLCTLLQTVWNVGLGTTSHSASSTYIYLQHNWTYECDPIPKKWTRCIDKWHLSDTVTKSNISQFYPRWVHAIVPGCMCSR